MSSVVFILAAAGRSSRFFKSQPSPKPNKENFESKIFAEINGKPLWQYSVERIHEYDSHSRIYMTLCVDLLEPFKNEYREYLAAHHVVVIAGGLERWASVQNAIQQINDDIESDSAFAPHLVAIHDAARPCLRVESIERVVSAAAQCGAAILGQPLWGTIKKTDKNLVIQKTVPREHLYQASTPQVFRLDWLNAVYDCDFVESQLAKGAVTDDAQLIAAAGHAVQLCEDVPTNIKVTTQSDLALAAGFLNG